MSQQNIKNFFVSNCYMSHYLTFLSFKYQITSHNYMCRRMRST